VPPLLGIRVLDLSGEIGAYGTRLLAAAGATVTTVEPPGGDPQRSRPPFRDGAPGADRSLVFAYYNVGKTSVTVDVSDPASTAMMSALAAEADVVVLAPSPESPVIGWDAASRTLSWAPDVAVVCCLSTWGAGGPTSAWRMTHLTSFAASGGMHYVGPPEGPPRGLPATALFDELSTHAAAAVVAALRDGSPYGPEVLELSLHDLLVYRESVQFAMYGRTGAPWQSRALTPAAPPTGIWKTADGEIELMVWNPPHWDGFVKALGSPPELTDEGLRDRGARGLRAAEIAALVGPLLSTMPTDVFVAAAQELRVPCAARRAQPADLVDDGQLEQRHYWVEHPDVPGGRLRAPGLPFLSQPPLLEVLGGAGPGAQTRNRRPRADPPLPRLRVISFGTAIAGNVTATILGEMGADVVKVESPGSPDPLRRGPISALLPRVFEPSGVETNVMFATYSHSCRSVALDMKSEEGRASLLALVPAADVFVDNFATGVLESWGLSHDALRELNPRLVVVTVSGYGRTGPAARHLAYGSTINSYTGLTSLWAPHGTQFDYTAVAHALFAVFTALARRDRTGMGTYVDLSQVEAGAAVLAPLFLARLNGVEQEPPRSNEVPGSCLSAVLRSAGADEWLAVELEDAADVAAAETVLLASVSADEEAHERADLRARLTTWAAGRTAEKAARELQGAGLAASPVRRIDDVFHDAQQWGRGAVACIPQPDLGPLHHPAPFLRRNGAFGRLSATSRLGQDTAAVLREWVGDPS
jgi:crotonobetainyl-CoA:carnitine CoA-transferase CaiB-like acyl-CoA transferase